MQTFFLLEIRSIYLNLLYRHIYVYGLIQKEKVDVNGEKSTKISIAAKKTVKQRWLQIMIIEPKQATH